MPEIRLEELDPTTAAIQQASPGGCRCSAAHAAQRTVTSSQLDQAVRQLRERRGRPAAEQMQAVLRALELSVLRDNEHRR
jgi:hypothetical protein